MFRPLRQVKRMTKTDFETVTGRPILAALFFLDDDGQKSLAAAACSGVLSDCKGIFVNCNKGQKKFSADNCNNGSYENPRCHSNTSFFITSFFLYLNYSTYYRKRMVFEVKIVLKSF